MDLYRAYTIGNIIQYLKRVSLLTIPVKVKGEGYILDNLEFVLDFLKRDDVSSTTQNDIKKTIKKFEDTYKDEECLKKDDGKFLYEEIKLWDDRITHELLDRYIIEAFTDGTLNSKKLLKGSSSFFSEEFWIVLSNISKNDLNDACSCLLTKSWTPAVMISLRAAEDSIRIFYRFLTKKDPKRKGWKDILDCLNKINTINTILLGYLNYIREIRNTAEHPDKIFNQLEAERVFHQVVDMIITIHQEIFQNKAIDNLDVGILKIFLKNKNLSIQGKKIDLVNRLKSSI